MLDSVTTMERIRAQREAHNGETKINLDEGYIKVMGWCKKNKSRDCQLQFNKVVEGEEVKDKQHSWIPKNSCVLNMTEEQWLWCHKLHSHTVMVRVVSFSGWRKNRQKRWKRRKGGSADEDEAKLLKRNKREADNLRRRVRELKSSTRWKGKIHSFIHPFMSVK